MTKEQNSQLPCLLQKGDLIIYQAYKLQENSFPCLCDPTFGYILDASLGHYTIADLSKE